MTKCWSHDVGFRPTSKDLDMMFTDMSPIDAEPILINDEITAKLKRTQKAEGDMLYRVFPRKVADKLKAGQRVEAYVQKSRPSCRPFSRLLAGCLLIEQTNKFNGYLLTRNAFLTLSF
jgi:hypothetical protein